MWNKDTGEEGVKLDPPPRTAEKLQKFVMQYLTEPRYQFVEEEDDDEEEDEEALEKERENAAIQKLLGRLPKMSVEELVNAAPMIDGALVSVESTYRTTESQLTELYGKFKELKEELTFKIEMLQVALAEPEGTASKVTKKQLCDAVDDECFSENVEKYAEWILKADQYDKEDELDDAEKKLAQEQETISTQYGQFKDFKTKIDPALKLLRKAKKKAKEHSKTLSAAADEL